MIPSQNSPLSSLTLWSSLTLSCLFLYFALSVLLGSEWVWACQLIAFLIPALLGIFFFLKNPKEKIFGQSLYPKDWLLLIGATVAAIGLINMAASLWNYFFPMPLHYYEFTKTLPHPLTPWHQPFIYLKLALVPAICEEMLFRGFLLQKMREHQTDKILGSTFYVPSFSRDKTALWLTAVLFALGHLNPWQFPFYLLLGLYLGRVQIWKNNIAAPIFVHAMNNAIALMIIGLSEA